MYQQILVAADGEWEKVDDVAIELASLNGAQLTWLHVLYSDLYHYGYNDMLAPGKAKAQFLQHVREELWENAEKFLAAFQAKAEARGVKARVIFREGGEPVEEIVRELAKETYDLVVVGGSTVQRFPLFSKTIAETLVEKANCSVLVVK